MSAELSGRRVTSTPHAESAFQRVFLALPILFGLCGDAYSENLLTNAKRFTVASSIVSEWAEHYGVVGSRTQVDVIARVPGRVKSVHVQAGLPVRKGDVLIELESEDVLAKIQVARSQLANAQANLEKAKKEHSRISHLESKEAATGRDLDVAIAGLKSAQAAYEGAVAEVKSATTQLNYTLVRSPIDGVVADKSVNPGDFAMPALSSGSGIPGGPVLLSIYGPDKFWLEARIPERLSRYVRLGSKAHITVEAADLSIESTFTELAPLVDNTSRVSIARIDLPNRKNLKLGMIGKVRFNCGSRSVIEIPDRAITGRGQIDTVFVDNDGMAELRLVRSGRRNGHNVEILSGLAPGEHVVLDPSESLRDGDHL
ncbi:MAG: efflux RND transporter periplasmic adaptor subunit [Methylococcaceae bacterium]|nr:efflux RND transporter periplasmic adaptor subunit [Methylococcaceae bacterium]